MRLITFIVIVIFLTGCSPHTPEHYLHAQRIMNQFIKDVGKKYRLMCFGRGGEFLKQVNKIKLSFKVVGPLSVDELRTLMVIVANDFLDRINQDEEIRPYLTNFPFNASNLGFSIISVDTKLKAIRNEGSNKKLLYGALLINGSICYEISNEDKASLQTVYEESYSEAFDIVKQQHPELFLNKVHDSEFFLEVKEAL